MAVDACGGACQQCQWRQQCPWWWCWVYTLCTHCRAPSYTHGQRVTGRATVRAGSPTGRPGATGTAVWEWCSSWESKLECVECAPRLPVCHKCATGWHSGCFPARPPPPAAASSAAAAACSTHGTQAPCECNPMQCMCVHTQCNAVRTATVHYSHYYVVYIRIQPPPCGRAAINDRSK